MKAAIFLAIVAVLAARASTEEIKDAHCFSRVERCCWKYEACGAIVVKRPFFKACSHKVCAPVCRKVCRPEKVPEKPRRFCVDDVDKYGVDYKQRKDDDDKKHKHDKKRCTSIPQHKVVVKCGKQCSKRCRAVQARCLHHKLFRVKRFCPHLHCKKPFTQGKAGRPKPYLSKSGEFVKIEFIRRMHAAKCK